MAKKVYSLGALILTSAISLAGGVGLVMVAEDAARLPLTISPYPKLSPEEIADFITSFDPEMWMDHIDELIDLLNDNPDLLEAFADALMEDFSIEDFSLEELLALAQEYPELAMAIAMQMGIDPTDLISTLEGLTAARPDLPMEGDWGGDPSGGISGGIDGGSVDPDREPVKLFDFRSNYAGTIYLRSVNFGDYDPTTRGMKDAPEWDPSTFMATPLLYPGLSMAFSGSPSSSLELEMGEHVDAGMIAPDYPSPYFTPKGGESQVIPYTHESRLRRTDAESYTIDFYPVDDISRYSLPSYLSDDESRYNKFVNKLYSKIPEEVAEGIHQYRVENNLYSPSAIKNHFAGKNSEFAYTPFAMSACPADEDIVLYFLNNIKEGTCSNYASASMLLLRDLGYAARYTTGYMVQSKGDNSLEPVLDTSCHAWVEYYVPEHGWQRFDATPGVKDKEPPEDPDTDALNYGGNPYSYDRTEQYSDEQTAAGDYHFFRVRSYSDYDSGINFFPYDPSPAISSFNYYHGSDDPLSFAARNMQASNGEDPMVFRFHATKNYVEKEAIMPQYPIELDGYDVEENSDGYYHATEDIYYVASYPLGTKYSYLSSSGIDDSEYYSFVSNRFTSITSSISGDVTRWRTDNEALLLNADAAKVKNALKEGTYVLPQIEMVYDSMNSDAGIIERIMGSSEPACYRYSAASMLILRSLGQPARLTYGYRAKTSDLHEEDAYYWLEVYQQDVGWIAYDMDPAHDTITSEELDGPAIEPELDDSNPFKLTFACADENATYDGTIHLPSKELVTAKTNLDGIVTLAGYTLQFSGLSKREYAGKTSIGYTVTVLYNNGSTYGVFSKETNDAGQTVGFTRGTIIVEKASLKIHTLGGSYSVGDVIPNASIIGVSSGLVGSDYLVVNEGNDLVLDAAGVFLNEPSIKVYRDTASGTKDVTSSYEIVLLAGSIEVK